MQVPDLASNRNVLASSILYGPGATPAKPRQNPAEPAALAGQGAAPLRPASHLPANSMLDALLNAQSPGGHLVLRADGQPDMHATLLANLPTGGAADGIPGEIGGVKVLSWSDDGSSDAASLAGVSDEAVAQDLIQNAGSNGSLSFSDVLRTMGVDPTTDVGKTMAKDLKFAWDKLAHGQAGALSASQVADAMRAYRQAQGDDIPAGGAAWRG